MYATLIIPPHIQDQLFHLGCIQVSDDLLLPLDSNLSLALSKEKSHATVEGPLSGDGPTEDDGVRGDETVKCVSGVLE
jgi:hypothetical protein